MRDSPAIKPEDTQSTDYKMDAVATVLPSARKRGMRTILG